MRYLIYTIFDEAQQRCDKAFIDMNCTDVNTTAYATPIKHTTEDLWAVCIDESFKYLFTGEEISISEELTEDWFPKINIMELNEIKLMHYYKGVLNFTELETVKPEALRFNNTEVHLMALYYASSDEMFGGDIMLLCAEVSLNVPQRDLIDLIEIPKEEFINIIKQ